MRDRRLVTATDKPDLGRLVPAAQAGDALALEELLGVLEPYVARLAAPIALQDAQDATQEALIAVLGNLNRLEQPVAMFSWARTITVREAVRVARSANRTRVAELADVPARDDPQLSTDIRDVLDRLTPEHRAILVLRDVEGLDERTASTLLDIPEGTAKSRLARARARFRKAWQQ
jgi:RNA polymerase sigma factor (sigma-70 family)